MFPQERERELLDSLKQSEIANVVTKGLDPNVKPTPQAEPRTEGYYKKRPCAELCALAADLLEDYLKNIT